MDAVTSSAEQEAGTQRPQLTVENRAILCPGCRKGKYVHTSLTKYLSQYVTVKQLTFLLLIRWIPGSNLEPNSDHPIWGSSWFFSALPGKCSNIT
jgi:hypothetical protein